MSVEIGAADRAAQHLEQRIGTVSRPFVVCGQIANGKRVTWNRFRDPEIAGRVAELLEWAGFEVTVNRESPPAEPGQQIDGQVR